ncbi:hypothetical protein JCM5353_003250 [Sporobolomyces roseus]
MIKRSWLFILSNTQFVVTGLTAFFILRIRTSHSLYFGAGTLVAAFTAKLLKKCIKQPRPTGAKKFEKTYGMPSTHSSSIAFFGVYLSLSSLLLPLHPRLTSLIPLYDQYVPFTHSTSSLYDYHLTSHPLERIVRLLLASFFIFGSSSVCWSRVRLGHHTKAQVLAGAGLGGTIAVVWLSIWLGIDGWSLILGKNLRNTVASLFAGEVVKRLPSLAFSGLKEIGETWERAAEDAAFLVVESWKDGKWDALKELRRFPIAGGEL